MCKEFRWLCHVNALELTNSTNARWLASRNQMVLTAWTQTGVASLLVIFPPPCKCMLRVSSMLCFHFALGFDLTSRDLRHPVLLINPKTLNVERLT